MTNKMIPTLVLAGLLTGCATTVTHTSLTDSSLLAQASSGALAISDGAVITDNDASFLSKIRLVEEAKSTLDLTYFIYADDQSSSVLSEALIAAARRGVKVRLLVDYQTNYKRLDMFTAMERQGNSGKGSLAVRFYNRPTRNIVKDAVYMTLGCGQAGAATKEACSDDKMTAVEKLFADEQIDGMPAATLNVSNVNTGPSGLLLSGLYGRNANLMALAIQQGQNIDPKAAGQAGKATPEQKESLKKLGKLYWQSRTAPVFQRVQANLGLLMAEQLYASQIVPVKNELFSALPIDRKFSAEEKLDWDHITDFTHQKLLLADSSRVQLGGRNVENSYHMHPNPLIEKYVFMDTDLVATLTGDGGKVIANAFDGLWNFKRMVATLGEIRTHAPDDVLWNLEAYTTAENACTKQPPGAKHEACVNGKFKLAAMSLDQRVEAATQRMAQNAKAYKTAYAGKIQPSQPLAVDPTARLYYLENLPFDKRLPPASRVRLYGAQTGQEGDGGKHITEVWLQALSGICSKATVDQPRMVILHSAYFFPPANLASRLAALVDGKQDCSHVTVRVITNSLATTDLTPVNLLARHAIKAFAEVTGVQRGASRAARFEYYEYQPPVGNHNLSLHSKVSLFGDQLIVGSANADVRSYMMDTNNAMLVNNAPKLVAAYRNFIDNILATPGRVKQENSYFVSTPRSTMIQEDLESLHATLKKYHMDKRLDAEQMKTLDSRFLGLLDAAYNLTRAAIDPNASEAARRDAQQKFNDLFQPI
ncbi:MAG: hypothetical protein KA435_01730 [Azonexus sp.]|nr:hypothetical protein [Azonexus sp.]